MSAERLQKVLASAGIASRRDSEAIIAAGRVTVNGRVVQEPGLRVDPEQDVVLLDGQPVRQPKERTYIMLHKPVGFVSTADDLHGRPTVVELVDVPGRVYPVGRLDLDSEGLILLTDDGELTHHLTHPKFEVEKEYRVLLDKPLDADALRQWRAGVLLNEEMTAPATVSLLESTEEGHWYRVVLREGRKRQIREVAKLLGYEVLRLIRVREGELLLGDLPLREWRKLTPEEVSGLRAHVPPRREGDAERPVWSAESAGAASGERAAERRPRRDDRPAREGGDFRRDERPRAGGYPRDDRPRERSDFRRDERPRAGGYPRDDRPRERSDFRRDERPGGYNREERAPRRYDERPPREGSDFRRDERPRAGGYPRDDRPREGSDFRRDERPRTGGYGREERGPRRYDERPPREGSDFRRDERPRAGGYPRDDRPREGSDFRRDERPRTGGYGREERGPRRYDERPPREGSDFRRDERPRTGGYGREERGPRRYDERPAREGSDFRRDERPRTGGYNREERGPRRYDERPAREGSDFRRDERPRTGGYQRDERSGGYNREERAPRRYDERPPREGGDFRRDERPRGGGYQRDERPREGGDFRRDERPRRYDERPPREGGDFRRDERPRAGGYQRDERPRGSEGTARAGGDFRREDRPGREDRSTPEAPQAQRGEGAPQGGRGFRGRPSGRPNFSFRPRPRDGGSEE